MANDPTIRNNINFLRELPEGRAPIALDARGQLFLSNRAVDKIRARVLGAPREVENALRVSLRNYIEEVGDSPTEVDNRLTNIFIKLQQHAGFSKEFKRSLIDESAEILRHRAYESEAGSEIDHLVERARRDCVILSHSGTDAVRDGVDVREYTAPHGAYFAIQSDPSRRAGFLLCDERGPYARFEPAEKESLYHEEDDGITAGTLFKRKVASWEVAKNSGISVVAPAALFEAPLPGSERNRKKAGALLPLFSNVNDWFDQMHKAVDRRTSPTETPSLCSDSSAIETTLFDFMVGNTQRSPGEFLFAADDAIVAIDNGLTFPEGLTRPNGPRRAQTISFFSFKETHSANAPMDSEVKARFVSLRSRDICDNLLDKQLISQRQAGELTIRIAALQHLLQITPTLTLHEIASIFCALKSHPSEEERPSPLATLCQRVHEDMGALEIRDTEGGIESHEERSSIVLGDFVERVVDRIPEAFTREAVLEATEANSSQ